MTEIDARKAGLREAKKHPYLDRISYVNGYAHAVEQLPSRDEIGVKLKTDTRLCYPDGAPVDWSKLGDAVLALIRERYEGES